MAAKRLTVADFFCGAGGFSEGFRQMGFEIVYGLDNWKPAINTHELNHPHAKADLFNILELDTPEKIDEHVPDTDIIIGSPPCVSFSGSNKAGKADKSLGIQLIEAYLRIIAWKKSKGHVKYWILENVPNSQFYTKSRYTWKELGLPGKGPDLKIPERHVLTAADYGAPQTRKRFFCGDFPIPEKTHAKEEWVTTRHVMDCLTNPSVDAGRGNVKDPVYGFSMSKAKLTDHFYDTHAAGFEWKSARRLKEDHGFMGRMSFPEDIDRPSRTVMATRSASTREAILFDTISKKGRKAGYRLPTIREIASFMSFPISYQFEAGNEASKYKLVGNAVCCSMASALARAILKDRGTKPPKSFLPLPDVRPSFDLTGTRREPREPSPKRPDAKFAQHIPHLKPRSFRVDLDNRGADLKKGKVRWICVLHHGQGKGSVSCQPTMAQVEKLLKGTVQYHSFIKDVKKTFGKLNITHKQLQESYVQNGDSKHMSPEKALEMMRKLVDRHYPEEKELAQVDNSRRTIKLEKDLIPIRIVAGLYACMHFIENLR